MTLHAKRIDQENIECETCDYEFGLHEDNKIYPDYYNEKDVKEAVKKLLLKFGYGGQAEKYIKEIFGEGLIHSPQLIKIRGESHDSRNSAYPTTPVDSTIQNSEDKKMKLKLLDFETFEKECKVHIKNNDCPEECIFCGYNDCPHKEPLHYHHDGCPACCFEKEQGK